MILIIGSSHDDIVYFESIIRNKKEEIVLNKFHATIGTIFNQNVMLLSDVYTSYLSSALVTHIIDKYFVLLIFVVGRCQAATRDLKLGDIAISRRIVFGDVNVTPLTQCQLCQIPKLNKQYDVQQDVLQTLEKALSNRTYDRFIECTFISSNVFYKDETEIKYIKDNDTILGYDSSIVFDNEAGGAALAGDLTSIPVIAIKVVGSILGKKSTTDDYLVVLKQYASIGRAVISTIGEFSRNDVIRE